jgi:ABC transport system ATP-binding/permease protein
MPNLINADRVFIAYGTRTLLAGVSLGLGRGDVIGVVGRNGDGKSTLLRILTGRTEPDTGRVLRTGTLSIGYLDQGDDIAPQYSVRDVIVGGRADHSWAAEPRTRMVVEHLLAGVDLDNSVNTLSGGERRRTALAAVLLGDHDLLVLDEPTNHLDVEAVAWLAQQLTVLLSRGMAMIVVSHDRWFLDAVCTRMWEVHDGTVDAFDGGYSAYVLTRAERVRQAAGIAARRRNLLRKELAWLRRGPPARTSKPKFRTDAANALIADEPPARDPIGLRRFATARLGKDVFDLAHVDFSVGRGPGRRTLLKDLSWSIGPGDRIGLVGANGSGKTSLLELLTGDRHPDHGTVKRGRTLRIAYLAQEVAELRGPQRVLESVQQIRRITSLASGRELSATTLLEDFGFRGDLLNTRLDDLSGGERRRLQVLRILLDEPNVLLLDEPTNDLDIDTLTVLEDFLDGWPGTLIVVTHDRYFLERVCDVTYALRGDGQCVLLPGGVDEYLNTRPSQGASASSGDQGPPPAVSAAAQARQARKELARLEAQLERTQHRIDEVHQEMAAAATDHGRLAELSAALANLNTDREGLEHAWLEAAERTG